MSDIQCRNCGQYMAGDMIIFDIIKLMQQKGLWFYDMDYDVEDGTTWNIKLRQCPKKSKRFGKDR